MTLHSDPRGRVAGVRASFTYGPIAGLYDASLRMFGVRRGVEQFLSRLDWQLPAHPRILDAGTGTGTIGLWALKRLPDSEVVAFDIDRKMLAMLSRRAERLGENRRRLVVAHGDLRAPGVLIRLDDGQVLVLGPRTFDAVVVGAALEHVPLDAAIGPLARLLRPGGVFLNLGIRPGPTGTVLARLYRCHTYSPDEIFRSLRSFGFVDMRALRLAVADFPANLTRIAVIARKP